MSRRRNTLKGLPKNNNLRLNEKQLHRRNQDMSTLRVSPFFCRPCSMSQSNSDTFLIHNVSIRKFNWIVEDNDIFEIFHLINVHEMLFAKGSDEWPATNCCWILWLRVNDCENVRLIWWKTRCLFKSNEISCGFCVLPTLRMRFLNCWFSFAQMSVPLTLQFSLRCYLNSWLSRNWQAHCILHIGIYIQCAIWIVHWRKKSF